MGKVFIGADPSLDGHDAGHRSRNGGGLLRLRLRPDVATELDPLILDDDRQLPPEGLTTRMLRKAPQSGLCKPVIRRPGRARHCVTHSKARALDTAHEIP